MTVTAEGSYRVKRSGAHQFLIGDIEHGHY